MVKALQEDIKSIYIHIPFCKNICSYCDFAKLYYKEELVSEYLESLKYEIDTNYKHEKIKTLYIGGGTPSSLSEKSLNKLFQIIKVIELDRNYEFTFECNIEDINIDLLKTLKNNKVNRISIGVESFNKKILKILNRSYDFSIEEKIELVKQYFNNINIDLMYGVNTETLRILKNDLKRFIKLNINHISIYSLILEDHTFLKVNNYKEIDDNLDREMYDYICKYLKKHSFIHYEISNFSKDGYQSMHNLTYWNNDKYYGFGLGASGFIKNYRYTNTRNINKYIKHDYILEKDKMTKKTNMENEMILGLRKLIGVNDYTFYKKYNCHIKDVFNTKNLEYKNNYYFISEDNLYISNCILEDFID